MLDRHPTWHVVRRVLGETYARGGKFDDAIEQYAALIAADYDVATLYPAVAELHWRLGRYKEAAHCLEGAPEAILKEFRVRYILGMSHINAGAFRNALPHLVELADLAERDPGVPESERRSICEALALCWFNAGQFDASAKCYEQALAISPGEAELRRNLVRALIGSSKALFEGRRFEEAATQLEKAARVAPDTDVVAQIAKHLELVRERLGRG